MLTRLGASYHTHHEQWQALGVRGWLEFQAHLRSPRFAAFVGHRLRPSGTAHSVRYRPGESDLTVFRQIFLEREYACLDDVGDPRWIVDFGANVGYSAAYLLSHFPNAKLLCLEPDDSNFELLRENTRRFGDRVRLVQAAAWSRPCRLAFAKRNYRDGAAWAIQVREPQDDDAGTVPAFDLGTLLRIYDIDRVGILKVDVERAELEIFGPTCRDWLDRCDNIVVELHDDQCERVFNEAIAGCGFEVSHAGELTVAKRRQSPAAREAVSIAEGQ